MATEVVVLGLQQPRDVRPRKHSLFLDPERSNDGFSRRCCSLAAFRAIIKLL
jgi:hypothetical protein